MNKLIGSNPERDFRSAISTDLPYLPEKDSSRRGSDVVFNPRLAREFVKVQTTKKRVSIKSVKKKIVNIQGNVNILVFLMSDLVRLITIQYCPYLSVPSTFERF